MKRFTIAVTITAMLLTMISPVPTGNADGWLSLVRQRNQAAWNARKTTRHAQHVARTMTPQTQTVSWSEPTVQQTCVNGVCTQSPVVTTYSTPVLTNPFSSSSWQTWQPTYSTTYAEPYPTASMRAMASYASPPVKPVVRYVERQPRVRFVEAPKRVRSEFRQEIDYDLIAAKVAATIVSDFEGDAVVETNDRGYRRALRQTVKLARKQGELSMGESIAMHFALASKKNRERVKISFLAQMRTSDQITDAELDENDRIDETKINWEEFVPLMLSMIRDILELLIELGIISPGG